MSVRKDEYEKASPVSETLPWVFSTGKQWTRIGAPCETCGREFEDSEIRGSVSQWGETYALDGLAYCEKCEVYCEIRMRISEDGTLTLFRDGRWVSVSLPDAQMAFALVVMLFVFVMALCIFGR